MERRIETLRELSHIDRKSGGQDVIAIDALWHFFTVPHTQEDCHFCRMYEFRCVPSKELAHKVKHLCSSSLFEDEGYVVAMLEDPTLFKELQEYVRAFTGRIEAVINGGSV